MAFTLRPLILAISALSSACMVEEEPVVDCSNDAQKAFVNEVMSSVYLWAEYTPTLNLSAFDTPGEVLEAMRYDTPELRDHWSTITALQPYVAYFEHGEAVGFGYSYTFDASGRMRVTWVVESSPAGMSGLKRGDTILEIGGESIADIVADNLWEAVLGPNESGTLVEHRVESVDGQVADLTISKEVVQVDRVPIVKVFPTEQGNVGYVLFMSFVGPSEADLRTAFTQLQSEDVHSVIVDLRYNGGGYVWLAGLIGSLIGGSDLEGDVLLRNTYNAEWSSWNSELKLTDEPEAIDATRVVFLTSGGTASASELLINGLEPFMDVKLVGTQTYGKPVGADSWQYCDNVLSSITFRSLNAEGKGDYFHGIPVDCEVPDDLDHVLGDSEELRLQAALALLRGEPCLARPDPAEIAERVLDIGLARQQLERLVPVEMGSMQ